MTLEFELDKIIQEYPETKSNYKTQDFELDKILNENSNQPRTQPAKDEYLHKKFYKTDKIIKTKSGATLVKSKDGLLSRVLGYIGSIPAKVLLLSPKIGSYPSQETIGTIKNVVENDSSHKDLTVRLGHTRILEDCVRLFKDKRCRNTSLFWRIFNGIPSTIIGGLTAKLSRADHYNPYTHTATVYSNVDAIGLHETGHAKDYSDQKYPSLYEMCRTLAPVMLWQEYKASEYAHKKLPKHKKLQTGRYLAPAYASYVGSLFSPAIYLGSVVAGHVAGLFQRAYEGLKPKREPVPALQPA